MDTRRSFLKKVFGAGAAVAAMTSGLNPLLSRNDVLNQLVQHLNSIGYQIVRYSKF